MNTSHGNSDFESKEAIEKLRELIERESICLFCTHLMSKPIRTRPMHTYKVDEKGNIWFVSSLKSQENADIMENNSVQLFYSNPANMEFLSVLGTAFVFKDKKKNDVVWESILNDWLKDGDDDPDIALIKVNPQNASYWDTK